MQLMIGKVNASYVQVLFLTGIAGKVMVADVL